MWKFHIPQVHCFLLNSCALPPREATRTNSVACNDSCCQLLFLLPAWIFETLWLWSKLSWEFSSISESHECVDVPPAEGEAEKEGNSVNLYCRKQWRVRCFAIQAPATSLDRGQDVQWLVCFMLYMTENTGLLRLCYTDMVLASVKYWLIEVAEELGRYWAWRRKREKKTSAHAYPTYINIGIQK